MPSMPGWRAIKESARLLVKHRFLFLHLMEIMVFFRFYLVFANLAICLVGSPVQGAKELKARLTLMGHDGGVISVSFHPDGKTLASAGVDKTIKLWDVGTGKNIATLKGHKNFVDCVTFSSDGNHFASVSRDSLRWWD